MRLKNWDAGVSDARVRGWNERIDDEDGELELSISLPDRLEAILQLRDIQDDTTTPRLYTV